MSTHNVLSYLLNPKKWWLPLLIIFLISLFGVSMIGIHTYTEAPPIATFVDNKNKIVFSKEDILKGQATFQQSALMEYGSFFGDGAYRGPDFTAEALHQVALYMNSFYEQGIVTSDSEKDLKQKGVAEKVKNELKRNLYNKKNNQVLLSEGQSYAANSLIHYYNTKFTQSDSASSYQSIRYIKDSAQIRALSAFFFWGAWVCGVERPGESYSYTHNWPFDPQAGNTPTSAIILWSILGMFGLILGLGLVLYYHGKLEKLNNETYTSNAQSFMTTEEVSNFTPSAIQKATFKYFFTAIWLFALQVLSGILTVHDFVGIVNWFGYDLSELLPITITRSWHVQLSIIWISACWIGGSFFMMSLVSPKQSAAQLKLVNTIYWLTVLLVAGSLAGILLGPLGYLGKYWYWAGHQGWEFVEPGKIWQILLGFIFILWAITLYRGVKPILKLNQPWALPNWLIYSTFSIILLLSSGFAFTPTTNFVIADFWRWMVVHMWAEAFFEVFTTVLIGFFMVMMGLVNKQAAIRVIYLATLLFLGSGLLGISHNFYWNAKPVFTMALGSVFSTLQVVPLVLLTLEAWRFSKLPKALESANEHVTPKSKFGFKEVFLFLIAVNFWNFFGAGVLGFIINLPIANYFEHGTYLTVNHGHAALMGVYGNLAIAAALFCSQLLIKKAWWHSQVVKIVFWSINLGLLLMIFLDLFPVGVYQFQQTAEKGLWYSRSSAFTDSIEFQSLTWLRIIGGSIFTIGGVVLLTWFFTSRANKLKN